MALQWVILSYVVAAEAAIAILLTFPSPKILKSRLVSLISLILQPGMFIVPFAGFQLLDLYWKNEHRLMCTSDVCTAAERDRYEKSIYIGSMSIVRCVNTAVEGDCYVKLMSSSSDIYKAQGNVILCAAACMLYWCIYRICQLNKEIQHLEEVEKRYKKL